MNFDYFKCVGNHNQCGVNKYATKYMNKHNLKNDSNNIHKNCAITKNDLLSNGKLLIRGKYSDTTSACEILFNHIKEELILIEKIDKGENL